MLKIALISALLIAVAIVLLGVKALFVKGGRFPRGHAHDLPALKKKRT